jgi:hypothetical protein
MEMVMSGIVHSNGAFLLQNPHSRSENSLYLRATFFYNQMRVRNDVKDDIEFAQGNVIPLWAFGMNY